MALLLLARNDSSTASGPPSLIGKANQNALLFFRFSHQTPKIRTLNMYNIIIAQQKGVPTVQADSMIKSLIAPTSKLCSSPTAALLQSSLMKMKYPTNSDSNPLSISFSPKSERYPQWIPLAFYYIFFFLYALAGQALLLLSPKSNQNALLLHQEALTLIDHHKQGSKYKCNY